MKNQHSVTILQIQSKHLNCRIKSECLEILFWKRLTMTVHVAILSTYASQFPLSFVHRLNLILASYMYAFMCMSVCIIFIIAGVGGRLPFFLRMCRCSFYFVIFIYFIFQGSHRYLYNITRIIFRCHFYYAIIKKNVYLFTLCGIDVEKKRMYS